MYILETKISINFWWAASDEAKKNKQKNIVCFAMLSCEMMCQLGIYFIVKKYLYKKKKKTEPIQQKFKKEEEYSAQRRCDIIAKIKKGTRMLRLSALYSSKDIVLNICMSIYIHIYAPLTFKTYKTRFNYLHLSSMPHLFPWTFKPCCKSHSITESHTERLSW